MAANRLDRDNSHDHEKRLHRRLKPMLTKRASSLLSSHTCISTPSNFMFSLIFGIFLALVDNFLMAFVSNKVQEVREAELTDYRTWKLTTLLLTAEPKLDSSNESHQKVVKERSKRFSTGNWTVQGTGKERSIEKT